MGFMGMAIGLATEVVGIIKDDEEMMKRGATRCVVGAATFVVGDVFGISDVIGEAIINADV